MHRWEATAVWKAKWEQWQVEETHRAIQLVEKVHGARQLVMRPAARQLEMQQAARQLVMLQAERQPGHWMNLRSPPC